MPPKQWKSTCMDSPLVTASMDCFQSWPQTIFHCPKQEATFGVPRISISFAHMVTTTVTFTDRVLKMSSKLHAALMLPSNTDARSVGLQITGHSNMLCRRKPSSRHSPLASAGGHGGNCDLTDGPYTNTKLEVWNYAKGCFHTSLNTMQAIYITDSSVHSEPCERQQCKRNARTKIPPVATKCRCTTTIYKSLFQSTGTARNDAFNHRRAKVQLLTYFQVGHWVASRNSVAWCCRTTAIPSAPPRHAWQNLPYRHKIAPAILIHESVLILYMNIKTKTPKKKLHTMMSRISHVYILIFILKFSQNLPTKLGTMMPWVTLVARLYSENVNKR